ncbi:MAG: bifunctional DNA primase/polymerase [Acidobacteriaceae bacterium]
MATASIGLSSVPLFPCELKGKRPLTTNGFYDATRDVAQLELWRAQFFGCNWGMPTGRASGIFVLDADGQMGRDSLAALAAEGLTMPVTRIVRTGNGLHYYFAMPPGVDIPCSTSKIAPGCDVRGDGGYVIAPESIHPNGNAYEFVDPNTPIADAPAWLLGRVVAPKLADVLPMSSQPRQPATEYEKQYAAKALRDECAKFAALPAGTGVRNRALNTTAHSVATMVAPGWLESQPTWNALWEAAKGYRAQDGDTEASNTMRSGWEAGLLKPRAPLPVIENVDLSGILKEFPKKFTSEFLDTYPEPMGADAFTGLPGEFVRLYEPATESDPHALLSTFLTVFGCIAGSSPHFYIEGARHTANLFNVLVGKSSKSRKGTSGKHVLNFFDLFEHEFLLNRRPSGMSSGEGLIEAIRDSRGVDDKGGVSDKRLFVNETEFAKPLNNMRRDGNNLSSTVRTAWDGDKLQTLAKNNKDVCTNPHIAILGHITEEELTKQLSAVDSFNGFGNRFLWVCVRRSKELPDGGNVDFFNVQALASKVKEALDYAKTVDRLFWDESSHSLWLEVYPQLTAEAKGIFGALTGRGEAQVMRLAVNYALLDPWTSYHKDSGHTCIRVQHLKAALAYWHYCESSVFHIFRDVSLLTLINSVLEKITNASGAGMTQTAIHNELGNNILASELKRALTLLKDKGFITGSKMFTGGRPAVLWRLS